MKRLLELLAIMGATALCLMGAKRPKPLPAPNPSACISSICIENLRWVVDLGQSTGDSRAMTIFGVLENRSAIPISNVALTFPLQNSHDSIIRSVTTSLPATIPPAGRWEFKAFTSMVGILQMVSDDVLYTISADVNCLIEENGRHRFARDTFRFDPVFNGFDGRLKKQWLKSHGVIP